MLADYRGDFWCVISASRLRSSRQSSKVSATVAAPPSGCSTWCLTKKPETGTSCSRFAKGPTIETCADLVAGTGPSLPQASFVGVQQHAC